jgi:ABC-type oligopeptide transport system substrate-binding subunit
MRSLRPFLLVILGVVVSVFIAACADTDATLDLTSFPTSPSVSDETSVLDPTTTTGVINTRTPRPTPVATTNPTATALPATAAAPEAAITAADPTPTVNSRDLRESDNSGNNAESDPKSGGIFNALWGDPPTLDPHLVTDGTSHEIVIEVFSGLIHLGPNSTNPFEADLAESWSISDDGTVYTFKLRNDLKFSNGDAVTAQDFKWSFERAANPDTGGPITGEILGDIVGINDIIDGNAVSASGVEVIDERTLRITIDAPKAYFIAKLTHPVAFVLNRENVESLGRDWTNDAVSTGPFTLREYRIGERIRLARNENYWGRAAYLDEVVFNLSGGVAMAMYENDEIDITGVGLADADRVKDPTQEINKELVQVQPDFSVSYIGFNVDMARSMTHIFVRL